MELDIVNYLKGLNNEFGVIYYFPNTGNAGDALIAIGTIHFFQHNNIKYKYISDIDNFDAKGKLVIYGGGGNLVLNYNYAKYFITKYAPIARKFVVLPHTVNDNNELVEELGSNVDIIARELVSFNYLKGLDTKATIYLSHDMALYLDVNEVLSFRTKSAVEIGLAKLYYKLISSNKGHQLPNVSKYVLSNKETKAVAQYTKGSEIKKLNCFRVDDEKTTIELPKDNIDLSQVFQYGTHNLGLMHYSCTKLMAFVNKYDIVYTNRLHVAITGCLLGKEVHLYSNSYYKNESIYQHTLKNKFDRIHFHK